ncbi:MAG: acyltransferase [Lewinellaceae bacterium]|nr:acyltransferase [Lewinellaceae bacterium]
MDKKEAPVFFPGLNGIRAIAALAVVLSHITVYLYRFNLNPHLIGSLPNGNPKGIDLSDFGVTIFFALSGFLITYLLLEENRQQPISVKDFYIRRVLRIWPLYYTYLVLALIVSRFGHVPHESISDLFYFFFAPNVPKSFQLPSDLLGHYWSLGVEEQFYLFWPLFVRRFHKNLFRATVILFWSLMALKLTAYAAFSGSVFHTAMDVNRFDCMLLGALGAHLYFNNHAFFVRLSTHWLVQVVGWGVVALAATNRFHVANIFNHEIMAVVTVALIMGQIKGTGLLNLNTRVFDFLGKISYGIYVIHPLVIFGLGWALADHVSAGAWYHYVLVYVLSVGATIWVAHLSYRYLEKPFLKWKTRYARVRSAGSQEEATS